MADQGMQEDWLLHPFTEKMAKTLRKREEAALAELKRKCTASSDPDVTRAYSVYEQLGILASAMEAGK